MKRDELQPEHLGSLSQHDGRAARHIDAEQGQVGRQN